MEHSHNAQHRPYHSRHLGRIFQKGLLRQPKENSHLIGASYMTMNNEFYKIMSEEISARIEAEGDKMVLRDPALNADRQAQQITEMLDMGIDVLVVTPVEEKSLTTVLELAEDCG